MRAPTVSLVLIAAAQLASHMALAAQVEAPFTSATRYNAVGQVTGTISPDPDQGGPLRLLATRNTYSQGLLVKVETGELTSWPDESVAASDWGGFGFSVFSTREYTYDSYGRKATERLIGRDGITTESLVQSSYDEQNRIECRAVRMNAAAFASLPTSACLLGMEGTQGPDRITRYTYDDLDQVLTEERAVGTPLAQTYATRVYSGHFLTSVTDARGNRTQLEPDSYGRVFRRYYPSPTTVGAVNTGDYNEYAYEANGNLHSERKRNGTTITYAYDGNNRPIEKNLSDNTYGEDTKYDYDLRGLKLGSFFSPSTGLGVFNHFDGFGRQDSATSVVRVGSTTVARTLGYQHDADGNKTRVQHPDGVFFEYKYDGLNRLREVDENGASAVIKVTYRSDGKLGVFGRDTGGAPSVYEFDNAGRLWWFKEDLAGTSDDLTNDFLYNPANQIFQLTQSNSLYSYAENANKIGNYAANGLNQYTIINGQEITYDGNGNLAGDGALAFNYDMENRLVGTAGVLSDLKYDPLGRLSEIAIVPGPTTQFVYDGDALVAEYSISGNTATLMKRYVHGSGADKPSIQYNGANVGATNRRYVHIDHQGSVIAESSSSGALLSRNTYDAYGIAASTNVGRFGYTGQTWLKELGLNYYKARMYSPRLGRFLQTDPIGYDDDLNLYAYAKNDPFNKADPTGMEEDSVENLRKRAEIAKLATSQDGSKEYAFDVKKDDVPANQNKCSKFVNDVAKAAGAPMSVKIAGTDKTRPPTAGEMANRKGDAVSNWRRLPEGEKPKPGDAAATRYPGGPVGATGHAGVIIEDPNGKGVSNISAHHDSVYTVEDQFSEQSTGGDSETVYLRYTGD